MDFFFALLSGSNLSVMSVCVRISLRPLQTPRGEGRESPQSLRQASRVDQESDPCG